MDRGTWRAAEHGSQRVEQRFEKTLMLGKIEGGRRRGRQRMRWFDGIANSWTWVWVNSGSWRWTWRPGLLQFMGLQRVEHNWATELTELNWAANTFSLTSCWLSQALFHQAGYLAWGSQPWCLLAVGKDQALTIDGQEEGSQDGGRPSAFILMRSQMRPLPVRLSLEGAAAGRSDPCCYQLTTFALSLHVHEISCAFTAHGRRSPVGCRPWGR